MMSNENELNLQNAIIVWAWYDAPKEYQELSGHGGDEDWVALVPKLHSCLPFWMEEGTPFGCCSVSEHDLPDGRKVVIGAHA